MLFLGAAADKVEAEVVNEEGPFGGGWPFEYLTEAGQMFVEADSFGEDAGRVAGQHDGAVFLVVLRAGPLVSQHASSASGRASTNFVRRTTECQ